MRDRPATRVLLVEGIPGSGKSTTAKWLCGWLSDRGVPAVWWREEDHAHPVIARDTMRTSRDPGYADRCVARWRDLKDRLCEDTEAPLHVLEGCLFQSTVRFLLEHRHPTDDPLRYLEATERTLSPLGPRLIYLFQPDPRAYLTEELPRRKPDWYLGRIAAYTETTAWARREGATGYPGMVDFYAHYREVCHSLVARSRMPRIAFDTSGGDWEGLHAALSTWLSDLPAMEPRDGVT